MTDAFQRPPKKKSKKGEDQKANDDIEPGRLERSKEMPHINAAAAATASDAPQACQRSCWKDSGDLAGKKLL